MVLDTSAVITMQLKEPGYRRVFERVEQSAATFIGAPTLFESAMVLFGRVGAESSRVLMEAFLRAHRVEVVPFSNQHYRAATDAFLRYGKGRHPAGLNFGDCMSYATAAVADLPLLFIGNDFSKTDIRAALL